VAAEVLRTGAAVLVPKLPPLPAGSPHQSLGAAVVNDVAYLPYLQQFPVHSFLAVPLRVQGRVMGVMAMWQDVSDGSYTTADQVFLQDLADRAALGEVPEIDGISAGGMPARVKCLHVLAGHALAAGPGVNPLGDEVLERLGDWGAEGPCVCLSGEPGDG